MIYNFKNDARNIVLNEIKKEFQNEIDQGILAINQIDYIPVDIFKNNEDCKIIVYLRKVSGSFDNNKYFNDINYSNQTFVVGMRSCSRNLAGLNTAKTEDLIYRLWLKFKNLDVCGNLITADNQHYLLTTDELERSFWEFTININNR